MGFNIKDIVHKLKESSRLYYTTGNPLMTDAEYDAAINWLRRVDPTNSYLSEVGPEPSEKKLYHVIPMGTLEKYHTEDSVQEWFRKNVSCRSTEVLISPKYDGFGVELIYRQGKLVSGSTRGSGVVGEDITEAVNYIQNIPKTLTQPIDLIVRGEAIIPIAYRDLLESEGYNSLRNAVPGIVRSNTSKGLIGVVDFIAYSAFSDTLPPTQSDRLDFLYLQKFTTEDCHVCRTIQELKRNYEFYKDYYKKYEIDGVVVKINSLNLEDPLDVNFQMAWKFESKIQVTTLRGIVYQIGATGKFNPVAEFDPVVFQGATITRASLGSFGRFMELVTRDGMSIGSQIAVTRQGDIIPYVKEVYPTVEDITPIEILFHCPYCDSELTITDTQRICENKLCSETLKLKISSFVSSVGVKGIGGGMISKLVDAGYLKSVYSVYTLDVGSVSIKGWGDSMKEKWTTLQNKKFPLLTILSNYPFDNAGTALWKKVLDHFSNDVSIFVSEVLEGVQTKETLEERFRGIKGIGDDKLSNILSQLLYCKEDLLQVVETVCSELEYI